LGKTVAAGAGRVGRHLQKKSMKQRRGGKKERGSHIAPENTKGGQGGQGTEVNTTRKKVTERGNGSIEH